MLPSLISRVAPADCHGTAMGIYSSSAVSRCVLWVVRRAVSLHGHFGLHGVFVLTALGALLWLVVAASMKRRVIWPAIMLKVAVKDPADAERLPRD